MNEVSGGGDTIGGAGRCKRWRNLRRDGFRPASRRPFVDSPYSMTKEERRQMAEERISGRLEQVARENSNDDPVLAEVLLMHLHYTWGKGRNPRTPWIDEPHIVNGVKFWCVGHNASHEFYVGTDGSGKRFRYSVGESCTVDIDGNLLVFNEDGFSTVLTGIDCYFEEVAEFHGYFGHF